MDISQYHIEWLMSMANQAFTQSVMDLHSFPTRADRITTVSFVYAAVTTARRAAIARRDAHQTDRPTG